MLIRAVMVDQKRSANREILPELEPTGSDRPKPAPQAARRQARSPRRQAHKIKGVKALKARILGYRPTRKHIFWAAFALIMVLKPWLIPGIVFVAFWVGLIAWLSLGPDRVGEMVHSAWDKLATRKPGLADRLRQRADAFALRFDALLEKLPDAWAERLALPDLSAPVDDPDSLDNRPDPFERLKPSEVYRG